MLSIWTGIVHREGQLQHWSASSLSAGVDEILGVLPAREKHQLSRGRLLRIDAGEFCSGRAPAARRDDCTVILPQGEKYLKHPGSWNMPRLLVLILGVLSTKRSGWSYITASTSAYPGPKTSKRLVVAI